MFEKKEYLAKANTNTSFILQLKLEAIQIKMGGNLVQTWKNLKNSFFELPLMAGKTNTEESIQLKE